MKQKTKEAIKICAGAAGFTAAIIAKTTCEIATLSTKAVVRAASEASSAFVKTMNK